MSIYLALLLTFGLFVAISLLYIVLSTDFNGAIIAGISIICAIIGTLLFDTWIVFAIPILVVIALLVLGLSLANSYWQAEDEADDEKTKEEK